jgi:hypothetical protein
MERSYCCHLCVSVASFVGPRRGKMRPMRSEVAMRDGLAKFGGVVALGLAAMLMQGCKRKAAPVVVQPVVRTAPRAAPAPSDFPQDDEDVSGAAPVASRARRRMVVAPAVVPAPGVDTEPAEEVQRRRDEVLLKQQESASQRQQQELNGVVQQSLKLSQEQQAEPRIQDAPEPPPSPPAQPGQEEQRIQDAPGPLPSQPAQPGQDEPRIQDAPGPAQTAPAPTQPQEPPQV